MNGGVCPSFSIDWPLVSLAIGPRRLLLFAFSCFGPYYPLLSSLLSPLTRDVSLAHYPRKSLLFYYPQDSSNLQSELRLDGILYTVDSNLPRSLDTFSSSLLYLFLLSLSLSLFRIIFSASRPVSWSLLYYCLHSSVTLTGTSNTRFLIRPLLGAT